MAAPSVPQRLGRPRPNGLRSSFIEFLGPLMCAHSMRNDNEISRGYQTIRPTGLTCSDQIPYNNTGVCFVESVTRLERLKDGNIHMS